MQTGSIISRSSIRSSVRTRYEVANQGSYVQGAEESSWSDTEDEADSGSSKVKEGINTISGQKSRSLKQKSAGVSNDKFGVTTLQRKYGGLQRKFLLLLSVYMVNREPGLKLTFRVGFFYYRSE